MRAAVLHEPGAPLAVEELTLEPPRAGEVRVRVEAAGVCHSDYHYMTGDLRCPLPVVVGHEGAGVVEAVGDGRRARRARRSGRAAVAAALRALPYCVAGQPVLCELGKVQATTGGLPDDGTTRLRLDGARGAPPDGRLVLRRAGRRVGEVGRPRARRRAAPGRRRSRAAPSSPAWAPCSTWSASAPGARCWCWARAASGCAAVMGARLAGAEPVIVVDLDRGKLALARRLGATVVVEAGREDVVEAVRRPCRAACRGRSRPSAARRRSSRPSPACARAAPWWPSASGASARRWSCRSTSSCSARSASWAACTGPPTRSSTCRGCSGSTSPAACRSTSSSARSIRSRRSTRPTRR